VKVLAEIPSGSFADLEGGTLRRRDLDGFNVLLELLGRRQIALITGTGRRQAAAVGLAAAATAAGRRVVLLEGDLSRPALAGTLGLSAAPGLHEYLRREAEAPQVLQSLVLAGPGSRGVVEPLVCIVAGAPTSAGPTLFASGDFRHVMTKLRSAYDLIVIGGPPVSDEHSLVAIGSQADMTIACCAKADVPRRLRRRVDGLLNCR
jgi:Mrp family chromosome partitioning ATPase